MDPAALVARTYISQFGANFNQPVDPGFGNVAEYVNLSVKDYQALVVAYCAV